MPRKFKPGDYVRVTKNPPPDYASLRKYYGRVFRVTGENLDYDNLWQSWSNADHLIKAHPYWVLVEDVAGENNPGSFWEGFLELDPFLGNAWRAKHEKTSEKTPEG